MISSPGEDGGFGFLLGSQYERRKQKLQQELQFDYARHVSQKRPARAAEAPPPPEALSLPIHDNTSLKEKLRVERNKEYNLFLQTQAESRRFRRSSSPSGTQVQPPPPEEPPPSRRRPPPPEEPPPSRRDAATLTESLDLGEPSQTGAPRRRQRRRWGRPRELCYSEEDEEDEESDFRGRMKTDRHGGEAPEERRRPERSQKSFFDRAPRHVEGNDSRTAHEQSSSDGILESHLKMRRRMRTEPEPEPEPGVRQHKAEVLTGLIIGADEEQTAARRRKEEYKQELLKQMAEQKRNKTKEKNLDLRVAATGATGPEKHVTPDRFQHLRTVDWQQDVAHKPGKDPEAPKPKEGSGASGKRREGGVGSLDAFSQDFSTMLGEMAAMPRVAAFDPLIPPRVPETFTTPHDAAYYYSGGRDPAEPLPPSIHSRVFLADAPSGGDGQSENVVSPSGRTPPFKSRFLLQSPPQQGVSPLVVRERHQDKQRRESQQSYQEALQQQIKEKEEQRRREKAKVEAEVLPYDPWGRGGCGAPLTDQSGDIFCDLKQMRRLNEEPSWNHTLSPTTTPAPGFRKEASQQQLNTPNKYMEALKQQMERNRRKQEEERERLRMEEEDEERRLAAQRARLLQEYQQEKLREQQKMELCRPQKQNPTIQTKTPTRQERRSEEVLQQTEKKQPHLDSKREASPPFTTLQKEHADIVESGLSSIQNQPSSIQNQSSSIQNQSSSIQNQPSSIQNQSSSIQNQSSSIQNQSSSIQNQSSSIQNQSSSIQNQSSSSSERFVSEPQQRANSAEAAQPPEGQQEVFRVLSNLRRHLSKEQKQLELQLDWRSPSRNRIQEEVPAECDRRPLRATTYVNKDNILEFTLLKYRDSGEEVRAMFPAPPTDAQTLDVQQQALLRQQRRKITRMTQQKQHDFLDDDQVYPYPSRKHGNSLHTDRSLPSETTFIEFYGGDEEEARQPSTQRPDTAAERRSPDRDEWSSPELADCVDTPSLQTASSPRSSEGRAPDRQGATGPDGDHHSRTGGRCTDSELDVSSLRSALERPVSMETIATEPWLRPGTSDALKQDVGSSLSPELQSAALQSSLTNQLLSSPH